MVIVREGFVSAEPLCCAAIDFRPYIQSSDLIRLFTLADTDLFFVFIRIFWERFVNSKQVKG